MQTVTANYITASQDNDQHVMAKVDMTLADSRHVDNLTVASSSESYERQVARLEPDVSWKMDSLNPFDYSGNGNHATSNGSGDPIEVAQTDRALVLDGTGDYASSPGVAVTKTPLEWETSDTPLGWLEGDGATQINAKAPMARNFEDASELVRIEALVQLDDYTRAVEVGLVGSDTGQLGLRINSADRLSINVRDSLGVWLGAASGTTVTAETGIADGDAVWLAAEYVASTGEIYYYWSNDTNTTYPSRVTWTEWTGNPSSGTPLADESGTFYDQSECVIGANQDNAVNGYEIDGKIFSAAVLFDGKIVSHTNLGYDAEDGDSSWTGSDGAPWTATGNTAARGAGSIDVRCKIAADDWTSGSAQTLMAHYNSVADQRSWIVQIAPANSIRFYGSLDGAAWELDDMAGWSPVDGTTYWVRLTRDWATGDIASFYSDESDKIHSAVSTWTSVDTDASTAGPLYGSSADYLMGAHGTGSDPFDGMVLNGVLLSDTSFLGEQVELINVDFTDLDQFDQSETTGTDATENVWTLVNDAHIDGLLPLEFYDIGALNFTNAAATLAQLVDNTTYALPGTSFTVSTWLNWDLPGGNDEYPISVGSSISDPTAYCFSIANDSATSKYEIHISDGTTDLGKITAKSVPTGWHHVALVVTPTTWELYINGVSEDSDTWVGPVDISNLGLSAGIYFNGYINDTAIFNSAFTPAQISGLYESGVHIGRNNELPDKWFDPEQLLNGVEGEGRIYGLADGIQDDGSPAVANGDIIALPEIPVEGEEYGFYTRSASDGSGLFTETEEVFAEFDQRIANYIRITTSDYWGGVKGATLYYKDTSDVWQSHVVAMSVGDVEYDWDLGGDINIKGVGILVQSTHWPFDVGRVFELVPLFKKTITNDDYLVNMDVQKTRENLDMTVPIGNTAANTMNLTLDNTEQIWSPDGAGIYSPYMVSDIKLEPFVTYEDVPSEWLPQGVFYADSINTDGDSMTVEIPSRDYSKYFQSNIVEAGAFYENITVGDAIMDLARKYGVPYNKTSTYRNFWDVTESLQPVGLWKLDEAYNIDDTEDTYTNSGQFLRLTSGAYAFATSAAAYANFEDNFTIDIDIAMHDWASGAQQFMVGQLNGGQDMWGIVLEADGRLSLKTSGDNIYTWTVSTPDPLGFDNGSRHYLRVVRSGSYMHVYEKSDALVENDEDSENADGGPGGARWDLLFKISGYIAGSIYNGSSYFTIGTDATTTDLPTTADYYAIKTWGGEYIPGDNDDEGENPVDETIPELIADVDFTNTDAFILGDGTGIADDGAGWTLTNGTGEVDVVTTFADSIGGHRGAGIVKSIDNVIPGVSSLLSGYTDSATQFDITGNDGQGILVDNTAPFVGMGTGFTISAMVKIDALPDETERIVSWADGTAASDPKTFDIYLNTSANVAMRIRDAGDSLDENNTTSGALTPGQSHFVACQFDPDNDEVNIWIDDTKQTFAAAGFDVAYTNAASPIAIGRHSTGETVGLEGHLQAVAIYDKVINEENINALYVASKSAEVDIYPYLYGIDSSVWDIMLEWATADVGIFYFDELDNLVYEPRTVLTEDSISRYAVAQHSFDEDVEIISGNRLAEITANKITVIVNPITTINSGRQGIWRAESGESLVTTKLVEAFGATEDQSVRVASTDAPLWKDSGFFKVNNEIIEYGSKDGTHFLDLTRGKFGTIPADHGTKIWDFENDSLDGMRDFYNCDLTVSDIKSHSGQKSMRVIITDDEEDVTSRVDIIGPPSKEATPIANETINGSVWIWSETASRSMQAGLNWYKDDGTYITTTYGSASSTTLAGWKEYTVSASPVKYAKYVTIHIKSTDAVLDDIFYMDDIVLSGGIRQKVREVRQYFIEYDSQPAIGVKEPFIVAQIFEGWVDTDFLFLDEFGGEIILSVNDTVGFGETVLLEGTDPVTELDYFFSISGVPLVEDSESDEVVEIDGEIEGSLRRHQVYELIIDNRFIQSKELAEKIAAYLLEHYKNPVPILELTTMGVPYLQLGDRIEVAAYDQLSITNKEFWIIAQNITYDGGLNDTYTLREVS